MTDYVCKPENKTTDMLKDIKKQKEKENASSRETMMALAQAYLTCREIGECEAYYKLNPNLHYKQSNIKTVFVGTGFPHERRRFLKKCECESESTKGFEVEGH